MVRTPWGRLVVSCGRGQDSSFGLDDFVAAVCLVLFVVSSVLFCPSCCGRTMAV